MNLHLTIGKHKIGLVKKDSGMILPPSGWIQPGGGVPGPKNIGQTLDANRGWVYACVDVIASRTASVDSALYTRQRKAGQEQLNPIDDHIFYDLLDNGNPFFDRWKLMYLLSAHRNLAGIGFWYLELNGAGRPLTIWPLEPNRVEKTVKDGKVTYKYRRDTKGDLILDPDLVLEFSKVNVKDIYSGWSPLQAGSLPYDIGQYIDDYQYKLFKDGGWFQYALSTEQSLQDTEIESIRHSWMQRFQRVADRFKPPVLHSGTKVIPGPSNLDLDLGSLDDRVRDKILGIYRVPKSKLGFSESANKASMFAADVAFNQEVIQPELRQIADVINKKLVPRYGNRNRVIFVFSNPVPTDREEIRLDTDLAMKYGTITDNEVREKLGYQPVPDGDVRYKPFNLVPVGVTPSTSGQGARAFNGVAKLTKAFWTPERRDAKWEVFKATTEQQEKQWLPVLQKLFNAQEKEVLDKLDKTPLLDKYAGWSKTKVASDMLKQDIPNIDPAEWEGVFVDEGGKVIKDIVEDAGKEAVLFVGAGIDFDALDPKVIELIDMRATQFAGVNVTTSQKIRDTLKTGITDGETIEQLRARVQSVFHEATTSRAEMIARTETIGANNGGAMAGYIQAGVPAKAWLSARDPEVRESHLFADEQYSEDGAQGPIKMDEDFVLDTGASGPHPGEMNDVGENVNCRCDILPIQED